MAILLGLDRKTTLDVTILLLKDILLQLPLVGSGRRLYTRAINVNQHDNDVSKEERTGKHNPFLCVGNPSIQTSIVLLVDPSSTLLKLRHCESGKITQGIAKHFDFFLRALLPFATGPQVNFFDFNNHRHRYPSGNKA
jgi:hypothetical protein